MNTLHRKQSNAYDTLFEQCGIANIELRDALVSFVEDGDMRENIAAALDQEERLQEFVEKAFALKFAPLQKAVVPEHLK